MNRTTPYADGRLSTCGDRGPAIGLYELVCDCCGKVINYVSHERAVYDQQHHAYLEICHYPDKIHGARHLPLRWHFCSSACLAKWATTTDYVPQNSELRSKPAP